MKRICVLTATRAEYGLLSPVIKKLMDMAEMDVRVAVTGMHLSSEFGSTWREIESDGVSIDRKINILTDSDTPVAITENMATAMKRFAVYFDEVKPDALLVLGDRYETLAVCMAAMNLRIPIFHIHGGEITEGAVDDAIRHCITKLSYLHFASTEVYRRRIIQMGEEPGRVFCVGSLGVENALHTKKMTVDELKKSLDWEFSDKYAVLTFHPVTMEKDSAEYQINELLAAIEGYTDISFIATKANADTGGRIINERLLEYAKDHAHMRLYDSLGMRRYLSALSHAVFVIGNSSSGIIEAPSFGIPTINIGDRQKGRIFGTSILCCKPEREAIVSTIRLALETKQDDVSNPYGDGNTSGLICDIIGSEIKTIKDVKKHFYDI